ncbi:AAA family ATPase [Paenibacillus chungangensis]|uniref:AAA family ATPase n=1 Tax=Paenibacillus chungangensis TaxID=696535 RepID=A0ABW3HSQ5_9BACL
MTKLYFGKFGENNPEQVTEKFYAAGPEGDQWYGGIQPGDWVYPFFERKVIGLWKVLRYVDKPNRIHKHHPGVVEFEEIERFKEPIPVAQFIRNQAFALDINLLNKAVKATRGCGFFELTINNSYPVDPTRVRLNRIRNFDIRLADQPLNDEYPTISVLIDNVEDMRIMDIVEYSHGISGTYSPLLSLYESRNPENERYTLKELLQYAKQDSAGNKEKYLMTVIDELEKEGVYKVTNPVQLYDNVLVGRKRTQDSAKVSRKWDEGDGAEEETTVELSETYKRYAELLDFNPNLILYGPPGTGKTYATQKIIEAFEHRHNGRVVPFAEVERQGRMKFVTFHQSYSYEEFIEGIRPRFDEEGDERSELKYGIEDGVLKELAMSAFTQSFKSDRKHEDLEHTQGSSRVWKVSLGQRKDEHVYRLCKERHCVAVDWLSQFNLEGKSYDELYTLLQKERGLDTQKPTNDASSLNGIVNVMSVGDMVLIYDGPTTIRDIGVIRSEYKYEEGGAFPHMREVTWLKEFDKPIDIYKFNGNKRLTLKTIYELTSMNVGDLQQLIRSDSEQSSQQQATESGAETKPYYMVIDEINRGNISKIFGELITLIEKDKRQSLSVTLPYSKKPFTLPKNLYLIGTMNTADRSIAVLDTALRRRFAFVEVEPDYEVFSNPNLNMSAKVNDVIDLEKLLRSINERLMERLDRDHRIGQAYFMDILSIGDLHKTWYYKVLPLLNEYFYNDLVSMQGIVGSKFFDSYGNVRSLSLHRQGNEHSEFEEALLRIYKGTIE